MTTIQDFGTDILRLIQQYDPLACAAQLRVTDAAILITVKRSNAMLHTVYLPQGLQSIVVNLATDGIVTRAFDGVVKMTGSTAAYKEMLANSVWTLAHSNCIIQETLCGDAQISA